MHPPEPTTLHDSRQAFAEKQASVSRGWVCQNDRLTSLAKTTLALLGITLCKARRIRMTNWERRPLSLAHEVYAALDAWVGAEALSVLEQAVGQRAEEDTSIAEHKRSASSSCRTPGDTRPSVSPGGPIPPEAGLLSAGGPVSPEAGILSGGGPVLPEVGLSSGGEPASPEAGLPLSRGGSIPPEAGLTRTASPGSGEAMLIDTPPPPPLSLARGCEITRERSRRDSHAPIE
ncbi:hypothetical protein T484DRAFT_3439544 [Baffinella frigidus]|nr:hypothetical protein T484DRAFT_3439544 [Cryptophyta sp. CCMP2293]